MKRNAEGLRGLYAITDAALCARLGLVESVAQALAGGVRAVQYRDKGCDRDRRFAEAAALASLCRTTGALFIVNDDVELALAVNADGVHVGRDDEGVAAARARLGPGRLVGASCYDRLGLARAAVAAGADYVAFGSFFPSPTKPNAVRADVGLLRRARRELTVPLVAIGGMTPENGISLVAAGADMLAAIGAVFGAADPRAAAAAFAPLFDHKES
jgi:thiamine-phosphate pyrophosphorylase